MADLSRFEPIAQAIAKLLHPLAEVVLHDIQENRLVAIFNNFSQRRVGDDSYIADGEGLRKGPAVHGPFQRRGIDGRRLKYVSALLRDEKGEAVGLICINLDVSALEQVEGILRPLLSLKQQDSGTLDSCFEDDWQERIHTFVQQYLQERNRNLEALTRQERAYLVQALQEAGAFKAKNAASYAANVLGVSRATVYNDLSDLGRRPLRSERGS